jgi:hypothetical protein
MDGVLYEKSISGLQEMRAALEIRKRLAKILIKVTVSGKLKNIHLVFLGHIKENRHVPVLYISLLFKSTGSYHRMERL